MNGERPSRPSAPEPAGENPSQHGQPAGPELTAEEIQQWIVSYLAKALNRAPEEIDVTVPFDDFALDSVTALGMTGELETWLGRSVDPTLLFDYPTIEQFATALAGEIRS